MLCFMEVYGHQFSGGAVAGCHNTAALPADDGRIKIGEQMFRAISCVIEQSGYVIRYGTIVDATIGIEMREEIQSDEHLSTIECRINRRP